MIKVCNTKFSVSAPLNSVNRRLPSPNAVSAVAGADGDGQRVAAGTGHELFHFLGTGVAFLAVLDSNFVFHTGQSAQLCLDHNTMIVSVLNNLPGQKRARYIFCRM